MTNTKLHTPLVWVIIALSVSAPVPAVVGIVINFGKASSRFMSRCFFPLESPNIDIILRSGILTCLSMRFTSMAITESCAPALKKDFPDKTSVSLGFGEKPEKTFEAIETFSK